MDQQASSFYVHCVIGSKDRAHKVASSRQRSGPCFRNPNETLRSVTCRDNQRCSTSDILEQLIVWSDHGPPLAWKFE
jgi:hypothetical protein